MSRAQLLRGGWGSDRSSFIRPPWSKDEEQFTNLCNRCKACIDNCPEKILTTGSGGFPVIDFTKGGCNFCEKCSEVCEHGVFIDTKKQPWRLNAKIKDNCLSKIGVVCQSCSEVCTQGAIKFDLHMGGVPTIELDSNNCNGCGDCVSTCPKNAIQVN